MQVTSKAKTTKMAATKNHKS